MRLEQNMTTTFIEDVYQRSMIKVSIHLTKDDVDQLVFLNSDIKDDDLDKITSPIKLIRILEQCGVVGIGNLNKFAEQLRVINKSFLVDQLISDAALSEVSVR
nr:uncharacterized protein LOC124809246 [Hydra vulgaris]